MSSTPLIPGLTVKDLLGLTKLLVLYARFRVDTTVNNPELVKFEVPGKDRRIVYGVVYDDNPNDESPAYLYVLAVEPKKLMFFRAPVERPDKGFVRRRLEDIGYDRQEGVRLIGEIRTPTKASRDKVATALTELRLRLKENNADPTAFPVLLRSPSALPPPPQFGSREAFVSQKTDPFVIKNAPLPPPLPSTSRLLSMIRVHYRW